MPKRPFEEVGNSRHKTELTAKRPKNDETLHYTNERKQDVAAEQPHQRQEQLQLQRTIEGISIKYCMT
ncbi:hypothetical protein DPMN_158858 [Dreissena polymorpha]|uniref:Uncharacterized protein n=1 Tax=Dreissena polymorpha TaxID=45954 RepID=A0A9D4EKL6_DREPO|nr:hypothetical protein DPMN_158858 [Dreissena polymorpha]